MVQKNSGSVIDQNAGTSSGGQGRVTFNLSPRAARALEQVIGLTGDSKTDTINRAISVYAYVEEVLASGGAILVSAAGESEPKELKIF